MPRCALRCCSLQCCALGGVDMCTMNTPCCSSRTWRMFNTCHFGILTSQLSRTIFVLFGIVLQRLSPYCPHYSCLDFKNVDSEGILAVIEYLMVDFVYPYLSRPSEEQWVGITRKSWRDSDATFHILYFQSVKGEERKKYVLTTCANGLFKLSDLQELSRNFGTTERGYSLLKNIG
jgi:hypothetical protein